jgi:hypothetical protein
MIANPALENILENGTDISMVCEVYDSDAVPGIDGFDPADALDCFAAVSGITFRTRTYKQLVTNFGRAIRSVGPEVGTMSVTFSNTSREIADFEFNGDGFEGLILVVRLLSRSQSVALTDTKIEFVGRCDKPDDGDKEELGVTAKSMMGSIEVTIPRRKYGPDDVEGRPESDPEFEGFIHMPSFGSVSYVRKEKKGGFLGWWNKKWVRHTQPWSSYSNLDANKPVAEVFGATQMLGVLMAAADIGEFIQMRHAYCEGEIEGFLNIRSTETELPVDAAGSTKFYGKIGTLNGPPDPGWAGPGYYSRTAYLKIRAENSAIDVDDPAPDVAAVIKGRLMEVPDTSNVWGGFVWTDDPAAHVRFLYTDPNYYNLDPAWIDDDEFGNSYWFNNEYIFNSEVSDFTFVEEG